MAPSEPPEDAPPAAALASVFDVHSVRSDGDTVRYVGRPRVAPDAVERELAPLFYDRGYELALVPNQPAANGVSSAAANGGDGISGPAANGGGVSDQAANGGEPPVTQYAVVARRRSVGIDGVPWKNILLALATVLTTLYAGTVWYHVDLASNPWGVVRAIPFSVAVLTILGVHEFGHYAMSRVHRVDASLPYFIPIPPPFGTAGAIIRMRGRIPSREALLDIGAAGPLAGIVATVVVTVVGLLLGPVTVPATVAEGSGAVITFHDPLLMRGLAAVTGQPLVYPDPTKQLNPVVFAGWLGMLVTFLNLLPVGQLDGGHVLRALVGPRQETVAALVPAVLFMLAGGLLFFGGSAAVGIWIVWGLFTTALAYVGPATPVRDTPLDPRRKAVAVLTFVVGALCFMPVPFEIVTV